MYFPGPRGFHCKTVYGIYEGKTKFLRKTIRSGQSINYPGNIVIIGDVNPGAEIYAAGNIIVFGNLRGVVHAGTNGNDKAIIAAFKLEPPNTTNCRRTDRLDRVRVVDELSPDHVLLSGGRQGPRRRRGGVHPPGGSRRVR